MKKIIRHIENAGLKLMHVGWQENGEYVADRDEFSVNGNRLDAATGRAMWSVMNGFSRTAVEILTTLTNRGMIPIPTD